MAIGHTKYDLRSSIYPTLNVREPCLIVLATGSKVNYLDTITLLVRKQYVLRLDITVNNTTLLHVFETLCHLLRYHLYLSVSEGIILAL